MKIIIETIPHKDQRYDTVGDWQFVDDNTLHIKVSDLGNESMELALGVHELVETMLCKRDGITEKMVDEFDLAFAAQRESDETTEPGDSLLAPYHNQHAFAAKIEKLICDEMKIDFQ